MLNRLRLGKVVFGCQRPADPKNPCVKRVQDSLHWYVASPLDTRKCGRVRHAENFGDGCGVGANAENVRT
jgi:hypothetical protein